MQIRCPITELHETKLYGQLLSLDQEYAERVTTFVCEVAPLMATIKNYFPYYTRHDAHHGYQVVNRMADCLLPSCFDHTQPEALTSHEVFLLIAAAYALDLGMTVFPGEEHALVTKLDLLLEPNWQSRRYKGAIAVLRVLHRMFEPSTYGAIRGKPLLRPSGLGEIPVRQFRMVQVWVDLHRDELLADWELATAGETPFRIDPLKWCRYHGNIARRDQCSSTTR